MHTEIVVAIVVPIVVALFASQGFWTWLQNRSRKKSDEAKLMMGIGYSKIIDLCEKHLANGYITTREFHELEHYLYDPYRAMGGNGTVEALFEAVQKLPLKAEKGVLKDE